MILITSFIIIIIFFFFFIIVTMTMNTAFNIIVLLIMSQSWSHNHHTSFFCEISCVSCAAKCLLCHVRFMEHGGVARRRCKSQLALYIRNKNVAKTVLLRLYKDGESLPSEGALQSWSFFPLNWSAAKIASKSAAICPLCLAGVTPCS